MNGDTGQPQSPKEKEEKKKKKKVCRCQLNEARSHLAWSEFLRRGLSGMPLQLLITIIGDSLPNLRSNWSGRGPLNFPEIPRMSAAYGLLTD